MMPRWRRRGDFAGDEVLADGGEVVVDALAVGLEAGFVPGGAELAAAADVGEDEDAAVLEPELADGGGVARGFGDFEAAVGVEQRGVGAVVLHVFAVDDEVGDLGAVFGGGFELLDDVVGGVEAGGLGLFELEGGGGGVADVERERGEEAGDVEEEGVVGVVGGDDADGDVVGDGERFLVQPAGGGRVDVGAALDVVERGEEEMVFGGADCRRGTPARWARRRRRA